MKKVLHLLIIIVLVFVAKINFAQKASKGLTTQPKMSPYLMKKQDGKNMLLKLLS